jgi:hypothetical protein
MNAGILKYLLKHGVQFAEREKNDMDNKNYTFFTEHLGELIEQYSGRFVVIKDSKVIADYDNFDEAYNKTLEREKLGTFLIQQCVTPENDIAHFAWHNVSFSRAVEV